MVNTIWDKNSGARVVGYGRVSTEKQEDNNSLNIQAEAYERDKQRYGWTPMQFIEESGSGTSIHAREGVTEILRLVRNAEVDGVWVIDPDRLCRPENLRDLAEIYEVFVESDVKLVTPTHVYDLSIDNDLFSFDIQGVLAKHNRRRLLQNMNRGKIATAKEGRNAGGAAPDGYLVDHKTGKYIPDPQRSEYVKLTWDLVYNKDYTLRQLVKEFDNRGIRSVSGKKWSLTHFHDIFFNEEYLGRYIYGKSRFVKDKKTGILRRIKRPKSEWIIVEKAHEPLVNDGLFYGVQEKLQWRRKRINHNTHMLTGIATCFLCGSSLHVKYSGGGPKPRYVCTNKTLGCSAPRLDLYELNDKVWNKFGLLLENPILIEKLALPMENTEYRLNELRNKLIKVQDELNKIEAKKNKLLDLYLDSRFTKTELEGKNEELNKASITYRREYSLISAAIQAMADQPNDLTEIIKYMRILHCSQTKLTYEQKVRIFRQFVYKIKLDHQLDFEIELYKTPVGDIPPKFRSFPRALRPPIAIQASVTDGLGDVLGQNVFAPIEVTDCSAYL